MDKSTVLTDIDFQEKANYLATMVLNGIDEERNKCVLCELLEPQLKKSATVILCKQGVIEEYDVWNAVSNFLETHILYEKEYYLGKNNQSYTPYLLEWGNERKNNKEKVDFWSYIFKKAESKFNNYRRDVQSSVERKSVSLEASFEEDAYSKKLHDYAESQAMLEEELKETILRLIFSYQIFFDEINSLDYGLNDSPRKLNERKLLIFHLWYSREYINASDLFAKEECPSDAREGYLQNRKTTLRAILKEKWNEKIKDLIDFQNKDYQMIFLTNRDFFEKENLVNIDFLRKLKKRSIESHSECSQVLLAKEDIENKAYGWINTVSNRIKKSGLEADFNKRNQEICKNMLSRIGG